MPENPSNKDYSFDKLLLKLSQLQDFHFDPTLREKDNGTPEDLDKINDDIEDFWKDVLDAKKHLQLNSDDHDGDYKYLVPATKLEWNTNTYFRLYAYLQNEDGWFAKFQKDEAKILWCLFAYVDAPSHSEPVKYLFGPSKDKSKKDINPHFLFRTYKINSNTRKFESLKFAELNNLAQAAYYTRKKATFYSDVDFVNVLQSYRKRTDFEFDNSIMYIPSGEIDCNIFQWLFLILNQDKTYGINAKVHFDIENIKHEFIDKDYLDAVKTPYSKKTNKSILEWMEIWGLIKINQNHHEIEQADFEILSRAKAMLHWMAIYLKSLNCRENKEDAPDIYDSKNEANFWRILALKDKFNFSTAFGHCYLFGVETEKQLKLIDSIYGKENIPNDTLKSCFIELLKIMWSWRESLNEGRDKGWQTFQKRCRFSTFIHYLLRFWKDEELNIEPLCDPAGLLAFSVLWDTIDEKRKPVGIFMSIIQENFSEGKSYFKYFHDTTEKLECVERIDRIRAIVNQLAKVENIEVYQRGIRHQQTEVEYKASLTALMFSVGHFLKNRANPIHKKAQNQLLNIDKNEVHLYRKTAEEIEQLSRHIKNIGNLIDILGRSIEARKSVFFNVPEKKRGDWLSIDQPNIDFKKIMERVISDHNKVETDKNVILDFINIKSLKITSIDDTITVLPAEFFYEEILYELLVNAIKNSFVEIKGEKEQIKIDVSIKNGKLVIGNRCKPDATISALEKSGFPIDSFGAVKSSASIKDLTGLIFIEKVLSHTNTGHIEYLVEASDDLISAYFNIAPNFKGLKIVKNGN